MRRAFIGVVCGLKSEAAAARAALRSLGRGSDRLAVGISGANAARAEQIARGYAAQGAAALVSVGVSGGLAPHLEAGDLILGERVRVADGREFGCDPLLLEALALEAEGLSGARAVLFGSDEIVATPRAKAALFDRHGCVAVDMESHGVARAAQAAGTPFAAIRAIADPASRALPRAALNAVGPDGGTRVLPVLIECARRPSDFPALLRLGADSEAALKSLRGGLDRLFRRLFLSLDL